MKEILLEFLGNFWLLLNSIAFFILIGVLVAGVFKLLLPDAFIKKHLGQHNFMANIKAAVLGIPLPLCSCSVIPFVSALKKSGASKSAIQTFLISTPITGADSIMATYAVFGWLFTIYRVITSVIISLMAGLLTLLLGKDESVEVEKKDDIGQFKTVNHVIGQPLSINVVKAEDRKNLFQQIMSYAFDDIYKDIARSLMVGLVLGALIVTFMPENLVDYISSNPLVNYALVLVVSVPLYVCATASIPLGLSLLSAGFSPGATFIFLTAGPATNTITMSVILKTLGKTSLIIYLLSVIVGSLLFGFFFDHFFPESLGQMFMIDEHEEEAGFVTQVSSVILLYLSLKYIINKNAKVIKTGGCSGGSCCSPDL
ncbi:MAG: SO_0444 family Cu/Zn efflux transporter [gamma proteobacterium symbiont of Bathyaustriella thionipta]|nr:SO_0444 family Cu/Zn efflux transporter [gamma proteobacterium symbiont of Bathyaustriella thionipta]MCU7950302.1 SO_0444 family Cu/Zn efflux transporter [gamma proteobacterium symbiont of Bathyaustriella thionipta]MCU7953189.1 SO_0444 family Cu/Zn efflux transporter [gamma proteobacterium symbiont of Bathyaustriella thionipta]MCU7957159.1 SO_0444 family Cu/Zn efflux transporter [gamma proteobacterium symbiont of Bathyaustriella thionipta]MCU7968017.1 SO_0444 family Cu/Zn efflux transporter 